MADITDSASSTSLVSRSARYATALHLQLEDRFSVTWQATAATYYGYQEDRKTILCCIPRRRRRCSSEGSSERKMDPCRVVRLGEAQPGEECEGIGKRGRELKAFRIQALDHPSDVCKRGRIDDRAIDPTALGAWI